MSRGLPLGLWGMNLGLLGAFKRLDMPRFLSDLDLITVRDQASADYLAGLGVTDHVYRMGDPAFEMEPDPWDCEECFPTAGERGVVGLNLSPLAAEVMKDGQQSMIRLGLQICRRLIEAGFGVLLVALRSAGMPANGQRRFSGRSTVSSPMSAAVGSCGRPQRPADPYAISPAPSLRGSDAQHHRGVVDRVPTLTLSTTASQPTSANLRGRRLRGIAGQADAADIHGRLLETADSHDEMQADPRGVADCELTAQMVERYGPRRRWLASSSRKPHSSVQGHGIAGTLAGRCVDLPHVITRRVMTAAIPAASPNCMPLMSPVGHRAVMSRPDTASRPTHCQGRAG